MEGLLRLHPMVLSFTYNLVSFRLYVATSVMSDKVPKDIVALLS